MLRPMPPEAVAADPTTTMLAALKRRISIWERMIAANSIPPETKQKAADEVLYLYSAMTELSDRGKPAPAPSAPAPEPAAAPDTPPPAAVRAPTAPATPNGNGAAHTNGGPPAALKDATGSSSTPLNAEDLAEFAEIQRRRDAGGGAAPKRRA